MEDDDYSPFLSSLESDFSTGYLEDALLDLGDRYKRRRLFFCTDDPSALPEEHQYQSFWEFPASFNYASHGNSEEHRFSTSISSISEEGNGFARTETPENEAVSAMDWLPCSLTKSSVMEDVSPSFYKNTNNLFTDCKPPIIDCEDENSKKANKRLMRVVYPFDMVKPGGSEGDITLNDINERILMPPTRPVRHPVGDFACRPCVSPHGTGLSGKAVAAITRIHTRGRGTITIIRTKG